MFGNRYCTFWVIGLYLSRMWALFGGWASPLQMLDCTCLASCRMISPQPGKNRHLQYRFQAFVHLTPHEGQNSTKTWKFTTPKGGETNNHEQFT